MGKVYKDAYLTVFSYGLKQCPAGSPLVALIFYRALISLVVFMPRALILAKSDNAPCAKLGSGQAWLNISHYHDAVSVAFDSTAYTI